MVCNSVGAVWFYAGTNISIVGNMTLDVVMDQNFTYVEIGTNYTNLSWDGTTYHNITFVSNVSSNESIIQRSTGHGLSQTTNISFDLYAPSDYAVSVSLKVITAAGVTDATATPTLYHSNATHRQYQYDYNPSDTIPDAGLGEFDVNISATVTNATLTYTGYNLTEDLFQVFLVEPPYNGSSIYNTTLNSVNLTWDNGNNSEYTIVVQNNNSYPTSPSDGWVRSNSTSFTTFNDSSVFSTRYYTIFNYNSTYNAYSSGLDIPWGALGLSCFNESNPSQAIGFDIEITNSDASITYTASDLTNIHYIDLNDIPFGDNTVIVVTNSSYKLRTYYKDMVLNSFLNYSFYLPPLETTRGDTDDGTLRTYTDVKSVTNSSNDITVTLTHTLEEMIGVSVYNISGTYPEWVSVPNDNYTISGNDIIINQSVLDDNTTMVKVTYYYMDYDNTVDTQLYILTVVGPQNEYTSPPVEGAKIIIKRYINTSGLYEEITSLLTDANGNADVYLIPETNLKIFISKDGYDSTVSTYIPSIDIPTKTFRITPTVTTPSSYDIFWDNITFTGEMFINGTIKVTYSDNNESTIDTQIYLYDVFNGTDTLINTHSNTSNSSFVYWVASINTSRDHELWLYFNNSANYAGVTAPVVIMVFAVNKSWGDDITKFDLEQRFELNFGPLALGYINVIAIIIPIILLCIFGMYNVGLGILSAGVSLGFIEVFLDVWTTNAFNPLLALMCPVAISIGFLYVITVKGEEHV